MKICFIAPCIEPGKDGVGDYTLRLASWLNANGCTCKIIGWNDHFSEEVSEQGDQLRLPAHFSEQEKQTHAKSFIEDFSPDHISLQWVPHGYHPKGLFLPQINALKQLTQSYPVELMIHEIWLGAKNESTPKERIIGWLQRRLFRRLISKLSVSVIHTQCNAYQNLLNRQRIQAEKLPLFSNIPVQKTIQQNAEEPTIRVGFFGAIHPETEIESLARSLIEYSESNGIKVVISQAGRLSEQGQSLFEQWKQKWADRIEFESLGQISATDVSQYLFSLHFGLSTTPLALIDKSGSVAAMWEHDLPVISLRDDVSFPGFHPDFDPHSTLTELTQNSIKQQFEVRMPVQNKPCIDRIGKQLIDSLARMTP